MALRAGGIAVMWALHLCMQAQAMPLVDPQDAPQPASTPALSWAAHNRSVALQAATLRQRYREQDNQGLTADGTLNTEHGSAPGWGLQARWQGQLDLAERSIPLWLQADLAHATGQTHYSGYLQSGNTLTPYRAQTGNTWRSHSVAVGVPLAWQAHPAVQIVPHVQWASRDWQRNLVQYGESYRYRSSGLGVLAQWAAAERVVLEAHIARRRQSQASISAPSLGFAAEQATGTEADWGLAAVWQISPAWPRWQLRADVQHTRWQNGASPVLSGLQAPPNEHQATRYSLGVVWRY